MIPTVDDVRSAPMTHRFGDLFNPPGLTNHWGVVQAEQDVTAVRSLSFPPLGGGDASTAVLYIDDRYFSALGEPVTFTWSPDRIEREARADGLTLRSTTVLPFGARAVIVRLQIRNDGGSDRTVRARLALRTMVTRQDAAWLQPVPPAAVGHTAEVDPALGAVVFRAPDGSAYSVQGAVPRAHMVRPDSLAWEQRLAPGETLEIAFVDAYGADKDAAVGEFRTMTQDVPGHIAATTRAWNEELRATFTPGNGIYGGSLPVLETEDEDILRAWYSGILAVTMFRRETPTFGRTYDTLMPRYWQTVTFLWDYGLSSIVHGLLDPVVMKRHLEHWMTTDIHTCFGTEWLTGGPVGQWYSVNDYAMTKLIHEYVRWSGDTAWLDTDVAGERVYDRLTRYATNWEKFRTPNGLADYGGIGNLLECVSTYIHEVPAMNAANAWSMRAAAEIADVRGDAPRAHELRSQATELIAMLQPLYADGQGYWRSRFPDGSLVDVRHCYDFITILTTIPEDLSARQRDEMVTFFERELHSPLWMHALSPADPDAVFSVRPDHQWTGAY
ncbi:MAG TPA: hypothetical protein VM600_04465, partial [Actinomycetota bacterium]|nr:hypothetical protein [Actinomycetota bacterium]